MTLTERFADDAERGRQRREHRTAIAAALRDALRRGGDSVHLPDDLLAAIGGRVDGTRTTFVERKREQHDRSTNQADDITAASTPLETEREDY